MSHTKFKLNPFTKPVTYLKSIFDGGLSKKDLRENTIGIAGTLGKTTAVRVIKEIFGPKSNVLLLSGTESDNWDLRKIKSHLNLVSSKAVIEVDSSSPGSVKKSLDKIQPGVGVVLNYSPANIENFGNIQANFNDLKEFAGSFLAGDSLILNYDDLEVRGLGKERDSSIIYFGTNQENCHVWANNVKIKNEVLTFELNYGVESVEIKTNFLGIHFLSSFLAAATVAINFGFSLFEIKKGIERLEPEDHKMVPFEGLSKALVIDDTYEVQVASLEGAIRTINLLPARRRFLILGEVHGLGDMSEQIHRELARNIFQAKVDTVLLGGGECKYIADELIRLGFLPEKALANLTNSQMVSEILTSSRKGDIVLVKGAKGSRLEEVVRRIIKHD